MQLYTHSAHTHAEKEQRARLEWCSGGRVLCIKYVNVFYRSEMCVIFPSDMANKRAIDRSIKGIERAFYSASTSTHQDH